MKITQEELYRLVNNPCQARGKTYFTEGMVELTLIEFDKVTAWVIGSRAYEVSMKRIDKTTQGNCTCPAFRDEGSCKHLAATGFALIKHYEDGYEPSNAYFEKASFFKCRWKNLL